MDMGGQGLVQSTLLAASEGGHGSPWQIFVWVGIVLALIAFLLTRIQAGLSKRVFRNPIALAGEHLYYFLENLAVSVIGPHGRKYLPMMATFWVFIFVSNILGLFADHTPTADWSLNLGLAIVAVLYVQHEGIKANGAFGHLKHFAGPKMVGALVAVSGLIFIIELISEAMKMISLSLRLYGNIHGGHEVVLNLNNLGHFNVWGIEFAVPIGAVLIPIKLLTCIVQALVFTLLFCVYLGLVTHHEEDHGPAHAHA